MSITPTTVSDEYTGDVIRVAINETREGDRTLIWATVHDAADDPDDDPQWEIALSPPSATRLAQRLLGAAHILERRGYEDKGICPECVDAGKVRMSTGRWTYAVPCPQCRADEFAAAEVDDDHVIVGPHHNQVAR